MNKPTHEPTKSIHGDAQPPAKGKEDDPKAIPVSHDDWMKPTTGDAQPQANRGERQDTSRRDERRERQDTRQVGGDKPRR